MERTGFRYALFERQNMAITKLMHMKEAPAVPHRHLANAVKYILDEKITKQKRVMVYMSAAMQDMTVKIS